MNMTRNILFVAIALTAAVGCKKKDGAGGGSDCAGAVDHMMQVQMGSMPKDMPEDMKKQMNDMMNKAKAAIVKSCVDTKWSGDAISCIKSIKSEDESKKCDEKLTKDQRDAAEKAAAEATGMGGPAMKKDEEPKAPEGSAAGSDMGSAAAGSAAAGSAEAGSAAAGSAAPAGSAEEKK
jgi:hypothetical protein